MTPEQTAHLRKVGQKILKVETDERLAYVKFLAHAASAGAFRL